MTHYWLIAFFSLSNLQQVGHSEQRFYSLPDCRDQAKTLMANRDPGAPPLMAICIYMPEGPPGPRS